MCEGAYVLHSGSWATEDVIFIATSSEVQIASTP
jgi:transketolase